MGDKKQIDWPIERLIKVHQKMLRGHRNTHTKLLERVRIAKQHRQKGVEIARYYRNQWYKSIEENNKLKAYIIQKNME